MHNQLENLGFKKYTETEPFEDHDYTYWAYTDGLFLHSSEENETFRVYIADTEKFFTKIEDVRDFLFFYKKTEVE